MREPGAASLGPRAGLDLGADLGADLAPGLVRGLGRFGCRLPGLRPREDLRSPAAGLGAVRAGLAVMASGLCQA